MTKVTNDYWIYDQVKKVLQRHHVQERKHRFMPTECRECPVPLRAIKRGRKTLMKFADGQERQEEDRWGWMDTRRATRKYWRGVTEFAVDEAQLKTNNACLASGKRRGDGEIYEREIKAEEKELWNQSDQDEWGKIVERGAVKVLSFPESQRVRKELVNRGELNRILPTRMVRRYKPSEVGKGPSRKSRWCIRGDRDPDILELERFAPTVATSSLQVALQAAMNHDLKMKVGDLKSAFTQSAPLCRKKGKIYCMQCSGGHSDTQEGQLIEVVLGCYGLPDSPLRQCLIKTLGYKPTRMDPCTFLLHGVPDEACS